MKDHTKGQRLTLEIDGPQITADKFELGIRSFLNLLKDVAKDISGTKGVRWLVDVKPGSIRIDFLPQAVKAPPNLIPPILDAIVDGIAIVEQRSVRPKHVSETGLRSIYDLASILDGKRKELDTVRVWRNGRPTAISTKTVANIDSIFGIQNKDWGTIEGRLSVTSERGGLHIVIYDPVTNKPIRCYFEEDILDEVIQAFRQRVSAFGLIRYRGDGEPVSVKVDEFSVMPKTETLPQIDDVLGILKGLD